VSLYPATVVPQSDGGTSAYSPGPGIQLIVQNSYIKRKPLLALLVLAPVLAGCAGASDMLTRDAEWFSGPSRLFIRNIEAPPLSPDKPVTAEDLVSAEGFCPGMASPAAGPADANAAADGAAATVEQGEADAVPCRNVAQRSLGLVDLPLAGGDPGLLVRVRITEHHLLDVSA